MQVLFKVPEYLMSQLASGKITRFGSLLKDVDSGRIVGHLQEAGGMAKALTAFNPFSMLTQAVRATSSLAANYQLQQMDAKVEQTLQASLRMSNQLHRMDKKIEQTMQLLKGFGGLQVANLAIAGLGLGVSVASFAYIKKRIDKIDLRLDSVQTSLKQIADEQKRIELERLETDLNAQLDHAEEAWNHGDGGQRAWIRVADSLNDMLYKYPKHIERELASTIEDETLLMYLLERYRILAATRIECLILTGELQAAQTFSRKFAEQTNKMLINVTPMTFLNNRNSSRLHLLKNLEKGRYLASQLREFQNVSTARPYLLADFIEHKVDGREFICNMKEVEKEMAFLSFS